jgi:triacylglycerol lipase
MSLVLSPIYAANLAANVYDIKSVITREDFLDEYRSDMEISKAAFAQGITGGFILSKSHVMAVFSTGKGIYKNQAFVAFKGTASLYDALTDLNAGVKPSHTGCHVHQGFYYAFDSVLVELRQFVSSLKGVTSIHCVGHSLGGAVATLAADWIKATGIASQVNLYTFGSPRVGLEMFARKCTSRIGMDNIYRVYHKTDPVPMVPTWPFIHVPTSEADYLMNSPVTSTPWEYHFMKHYIKSVENSDGSRSIKNKRPKGYGEAAIEKWLESDSIVSFTANTLDLLDAAILYVVEKVVNLAGIVTVTGFTATFTFLDRMAMFMSKAAKVSETVSVWVFHLVKKMAALIGVVVKKGEDLTVTFIRMVFLRVYQKINDMIWRIGREID